MAAHNKKYPWADWLAPGSAITLLRGTHYHCETHSLVQQARNAARRLGVLLSVKRRGLPVGTVQLTAKPKPARPSRAPRKAAYRRPAPHLRGH